MDETRQSSAQTVVALFDDQIDAEHALASLRKAAGSASNVSVLARDKRIDSTSSDSPLDVTRAVMDTALSAMSNWLTGLVALMVPEQGHFLAAGPIGVVLSRIRPEADDRASASTGFDGPQTEPVGSVGLALERFGFRQNEAHYLEQRLAAGSAMIAVTASSREQVDSTLKTFAEYNAVFIGQAETSGEVVAEARQGLVKPMTVSDTDVIVADVVAPLRHTSSDPRIEGIAARLADIEAVDLTGERVGSIDDVLVDPIEDGLIRYLVIGHGGVLGLARRRFAVPIDVARIEESPVVLRRERATFGDCPSYDSGVPFSRKDEEAVHRFFGTKPYWLDESTN
ncbi:MAG: PRC-barrel domain-containing protein [Thermomicrobiales bacterium]|nr:PRC-barrel domain-containing protein [Thermomicrobiales bacterium]